MATQESMAIRCDAALTQIEDSLSELLGADLERLPRVNRDRDMLRVIQLEQIAQWISALQEAELAPVTADANAMFSMSMEAFPKNAPLKPQRRRK